MQPIDTVKQRFLALNRDRLARMRDNLRGRQAEVIDLIPLLFHVNHAAMPGYVSENTPVGIADFSPATRLIENLVRIVPGVEYKRRALARYDIHALYLMGSSGTIAHSSQSDFDIWLCHRPDLTPAQVDALQEKASAIEKWAAEFDLEVHFFLMNQEDFRNGKVVALSHESSGSAQHHLLLDEFYRTGLLLAGRYPIWWLVPPHEETRYAEYTQRLLREGAVRVNETVDFGGLPRAPAEEFFGAALWQLYKSIDSPYKAALKLMLMEAYAAEYPEVDLLALRFKRAVHEGRAGLASLDPYVMLYRKIEEYLQGQGDDERLALMRRCVYFKVGEPLGRGGHAPGPEWCVDIMRGLVQEWGWTPGYLHVLDSRRRWNIHQVLDERRSLVSALTQSYHALSRFGRLQNVLARIDQNDLNILGRKLYAAFERKAGKVDIVNRGISEDVWESHVSLHQLPGRDRSGWLLYRGMVPIEEAERTRPLKRSRSVVDLLAWCHLNELIDERTLFTVNAKDSILAVNETRAIARALERFFPEDALAPSSFEVLAQPPALERVALFLNVGARPDGARVREGKQLASDKTDALSYGGVCENQILSIDQVVLTSWHEIMVYNFEGETGLFECLSAYLRWSPPPGARPPKVEAFCFSSGQTMSIVRRIGELFADVVDCYYTDDPHRAAARYVLLVGQKYYVLSFEEDRLNYRRLDSHNELLHHLADPVPTFSPVVIDRHALKNDILPLIFRNNKAGVVQIYCVEENQGIYLYFVDERGSLFCRRAPRTDMHMLVCHYRRFLASVAARQGMQPSGGGHPAGPGQRRVEVYLGHKRYHGKSVLASYQEPPEPEQPSHDVQVITGVSEQGRPEYTIWIGGTEFSSLEFGDQVYHRAAGHIMELRKGGQRYPIHITDIDLAHQLVGAKSPDQLQTVHFLEYKRRIEDRLNLALASLDGEHAAGTGS